MVVVDAYLFVDMRLFDPDQLDYLSLCFCVAFKIVGRMGSNLTYPNVLIQIENAPDCSRACPDEFALHYDHFVPTNSQVALLSAG